MDRKLLLAQAIVAVCMITDKVMRIIYPGPPDPVKFLVGSSVLAATSVVLYALWLGTKRFRRGSH